MSVGQGVGQGPSVGQISEARVASADLQTHLPGRIALQETIRRLEVPV